MLRNSKDFGFSWCPTRFASVIAQLYASSHQPSNRNGISRPARPQPVPISQESRPRPCPFHSFRTSHTHPLTVSQFKGLSIHVHPLMCLNLPIFPPGHTLGYSQTVFWLPNRLPDVRLQPHQTSPFHAAPRQLQTVRRHHSSIQVRATRFAPIQLRRD